jgi:hypothetical protein
VSKLTTLVFSFILFGSLSLAALARQENFSICKQNKIVRTLRSMGPEGDDGCRAFYGKNGNETQVGQGKFGETCVKIVQNIRTNLEAAGWKCKDIKQYTSTNAQ